MSFAWVFFALQASASLRSGGCCTLSLAVGGWTGTRSGDGGGGSPA